MKFGKKSQAYVILIFLISILVLGFVISLLMKPVKDIYNETHDDEAVQDDVYQQFFVRSKTVWMWSPFILGLGILAWTILKSHERTRYE